MPFQMIESSLVLLVMLQRFGVNCVLNTYQVYICRLFHLYSLLTSQVTLTALEEMFQGARGIMNWLGDCAKVCRITLVLICAHCAYSCSWKWIENKMYFELYTQFMVLMTKTIRTDNCI